MTWWEWTLLVFLGAPMAAVICYVLLVGTVMLTHVWAIGLAAIIPWKPLREFRDAIGMLIDY